MFLWTRRCNCCGLQWFSARLPWFLSGSLPGAACTFSWLLGEALAAVAVFTAENHLMLQPLSCTSLHATHSTNRYCG